MSPHYKLNLSSKYSPPYEQLVWSYKKANTKSIRKSLEPEKWKTLFSNKTVNKQFSILNETIINIFSNFVPNKCVTFDDSEPPWMNDYIKNKIKWKHQIYKTYQKMVIKTVTITNYKKQQVQSLNWLVDIRKNIKIT